MIITACLNDNAVIFRQIVMLRTEGKVEKKPADIIPGELVFNYGPSTGGMIESVRIALSTPVAEYGGDHASYLFPHLCNLVIWNPESCRFT